MSFYRASSTSATLRFDPNAGRSDAALGRQRYNMDRHMDEKRISANPKSDVIVILAKVRWASVASNSA
jgi:hypothetical protein